ncbi:stage V sporulation protein S [Alicyclobacillus tolerans]|uniref:stage V sporulation protein S n=1 Tax=Alicyclobacillus tolerans TaxID=90970 RepID=UPI003B7A883F
MTTTYTATIQVASRDKVSKVAQDLARALRLTSVVVVSCAGKDSISTAVKAIAALEHFAPGVIAKICFSKRPFGDIENFTFVDFTVEKVATNLE